MFDRAKLDAERCHGFSLRWPFAMINWRHQAAAVYPAAAGPTQTRRFVNRRSLAGCVALLLFLGFSISVPAAEEIPPPFGFKWNDSMTKIETTLNGAKAKIVS